MRFCIYARFVFAHYIYKIKAIESFLSDCERMIRLGLGLGLGLS